MASWTHEEKLEAIKHLQDAALALSQCWASLSSMEVELGVQVEVEDISEFTIYAGGGSTDTDFVSDAVALEYLDAMLEGKKCLDSDDDDEDDEDDSDLIRAAKNEANSNS